MSSDTKTRTIMLADLVGSTSKVTRMDTEQGAGFLQDATQPIEDAVLQHDGTIIKFTGDGYIATFESADDALEAADEIRNTFLRQRFTPAGIVLDGVRIVINTADVVVEADDLMGDGIIVVARLEKNVPTNHIWLTAATREVCSSTMFTFEDVGEIHIRGRARPVYVYALADSEANYVEENVVLVITDLHRYIEVGETLSPTQLNNWLMKWGNLHREAVQGIKGRVRQFVADMALLTFISPDEAVHALLNLQALVKIHNEKSQSGLPPYHFKAALVRGNLILSPTGVVGPLVNRTFEILNLTPRLHACMDEATFKGLDHYRKHFAKQPVGEETLYITTTEASE
jgi:class 3 adenylate cyclase